jgi:hypothetical protein
MKRGLHGVYHHASPKHLDRYVSEFTFRLNDGDVARHPEAHRLPPVRRQRQAAYLQGPDRMTEILKALDAITSRVLAYRPKDKGVAATKMRDQIKKAERKAKREERE